MGRKRKMEMNSFLNESSNSSQTHLNIIQRSAANDRERTRMRVLSKAFVKLKTSLPWVPSDTKLSKLDTLKLATSYIAYLTKILEDDDLNTANLTQPPLGLNSTPFSGKVRNGSEYSGHNLPISVNSSNPQNGFSWLFPLNNNNDGCSYSESNSNRPMSASDLHANQDNHYGMYSADPNI